MTKITTYKFMSVNTKKLFLQKIIKPIKDMQNTNDFQIRAKTIIYQLTNLRIQCDLELLSFCLVSAV